ncbi:MAG TPA: molybdopterin cofactor-binding domain-containing protein [Candidatus Limnocylindrales bacterium]|nr:molybdopterin cofactor-binding domain-containing protein [Candidatus Limnocylindrales bacterium]
MQPTEPSSSLRLVVNGVATEVTREPDRSLLGVLRDELDVTGPKPGCGEGVCGACTVLLDDRPVRSCRTWLSAAAGRPVLTIEGLAAPGAMHPVQQAFLDEGAFQCGYCTPGMILSTVALLEATPEPDDAAIRAGLADNVCRCGTYPRILAAVRRAAGGRVNQPEHVPGIAGTPPEAGVVAPPVALDVRPKAPWDMTPTAERDWFDVLPDGLVVVAEPDWSGGWSTSAGAWLHVGADGLVTAFTGKVDAGQDNRTGLSILVAEAVGVPLEDVRLVMGDTDLCPHDEGTFGSRSTPDAGRELRIAGAAARGILAALARAQDGSPGSIGALVRGLRRVETADRRERHAARTASETTSGRSPTDSGSPTAAIHSRAGVARLTGRSIVTGSKRYPSDLHRPGLRHGQVLRPPAAGAELRSVDLADVPADGLTVVHDGSFVGVVAASPGQARRSLARVMPEWDLPDVPGEADLEPHLRGHPVEDEGWEGGFHREAGDVDHALAAAQVHLEATYRTAFIAHVPMETRAAVAEWGEDGRLTVWTGTQVPFGVREEVAAALAIPEASVRVIVPDFGGGFGGKHAGEVAVEAARLARAAAVPVKVRWSREDEFRHGYVRPAAVIDVLAGASRDGRLTAWQMTNLNSGSFGLAGPYEVPNQRLDYQAAASPLRQGSYRALAATANHFARESAMDEIAVALEIDPLELRLTHLEDERLAAVLRAAADRIEWRREREPGTGLGIAGGIEKESRVATAVELRVGDDRRPQLTRIVVAFDCGRIVNPDALTNQVQGATSMGLGGALFEAVHYEAGGVLTNASMTDYRVPRITDLPPIEVVLLDRPEVPSAGAGETPIVALAPAIANAIFDATGVRLRQMPLVPGDRIPD